MSCYKFQDHIGDYIEKNLDLNLQRELTEHLSQCQLCRQQLKETKILISAMRGLPSLRCSSAFEANLMKKIQAKGLKHSGAIRARWITYSRNLSVAAAIILLITASWLSVNWLNPTIQEPQVPISKLLEESGRKGEPLQHIITPVKHTLSPTESENDSSQTPDRPFQPRIQLVNEQNQR